jgi:tetratricopeptide (TPR) repeat protein
MVSVLLLAACGQETPAVKRNAALDRALKALQLGETDEALKHIDAAIALDAHAAHLHQVKGSILFHARRFGEAVASYDQAYQLNGRSAEAALGAGLSLAMQGKDDEAAIRYDKAEELYSYRASNPPDAEQFSQDAIDSAMIDARLHLALIAALRGQTAAALGQIDRLKAAYPEWEQAERWRGVVQSGALEQLLAPTPE